MNSVKAVLVANTQQVEAQDEMNNPIVIILDKETDETIKHFRIEAESMEDLQYMYREKTFFTSSISEGSHLKAFGATFLGMPKDYYKEKDAQLQLNALENII